MANTFHHNNYFSWLINRARGQQSSGATSVNIIFECHTVQIECRSSTYSATKLHIFGIFHKYLFFWFRIQNEMNFKKKKKTQSSQFVQLWSNASSFRRRYKEAFLSICLAVITFQAKKKDEKQVPFNWKQTKCSFGTKSYKWKMNSVTFNGNTRRSALTLSHAIVSSCMRYTDWQKTASLFNFNFGELSRFLATLINW